MIYPVIMVVENSNKINTIRDLLRLGARKKSVIIMIPV